MPHTLSMSWELCGYKAKHRVKTLTYIIFMLPQLECMIPVEEECIKIQNSYSRIETVSKLMFEWRQGEDRKQNKIFFL